MKALCVGLLAAGLLVGIAHSLQCNTCTQVATVDACRNPTTCTVGFDTFCKKLVIPLSTGAVSITKSCAGTCTEGPETTAQGAGTAYCCKGDLCNGATSVRLSYTLLALGAAVSTLLLRAGL